MPKDLGYFYLDNIKLRLYHGMVKPNLGEESGGSGIHMKGM